jgi:protein phosphatase
VQRFKLQRGDQLLLCTDGLTETVDDSTIAHVLLDAKSAQRACQDLVELALAGGGSDNVTVVLANFSSTTVL